MIVSSFPLLAQARKECKASTDCTIVSLVCSCMYCARETDLKEKLIESVNIKYAKSYENLSQCSPQQIKSCSMAGACAQNGIFVSECFKGICAANFKHE
jgi:hypothetical protein